MVDLFDYYNNNPVGVIDQNSWTDKDPEVAMQFQTGPTIYTPLIEWTDQSKTTGAQYSQFTELLEGEADTEELTMTQQYIPEPLGVDSRMRQITVARYGDKVQLLKSSNYFQQWKMSGGRDWRPILRGVLGSNIRRKIEGLSRNSFLRGPKAYWTYGGDASNMATLQSGDVFGLDIVNEWNLRLGQLGDPIIPGDIASAKLAIVPPGSIYDFQKSLATADKNETALWRDASLYRGEALKYEIGTYKNIRFMVAPNDKYGQSMAVLYNAGAVEHQVCVMDVINMGDGSPNPETTKVDETWYVGQKAAAHSVHCTGYSLSGFAVNDIVAIHTNRTTLYGDPDGVDVLHGKTIHRRIVAIDGAYMSFDRPILFNYKTKLSSFTPKGGSSEANAYAIITKAAHVGFILVLGSKGGIKANVNKPLEFYEPKPVDDFESVWRYVWDIVAGYNVWDPLLFECHFVAITLPKPGGVITPNAESS
jgi:hypothetical protein